MTSGGARARSGPVPDPLALARNRPSDQVTWTHLPALREGDPPAWPLTRTTARERTLWAREWKRPQAVMWERNGWESEVALYVRTLALAERTKGPLAARTLYRQFLESLGISSDGLRRNRWIIDQPSGDAQGPEADVQLEETSARDRLKLVAS